MRQLFSSRAGLAAVDPTPAKPPHSNCSQWATMMLRPQSSSQHSAAPLAVTPSQGIQQGDNCTAAAFMNEAATKLGHEGVLFQRPAAKPTSTPPPKRPRPAERQPEFQPAACMATPPAVTAVRTEIIDYLRRTNICFQHAFGGKCSRHEEASCPYTHGVIAEALIPPRADPNARTTTSSAPSRAHSDACMP